MVDDRNSLFLRCLYGIYQNTEKMMGGALMNPLAGLYHSLSIRHIQTHGGKKYLMDKELPMQLPNKY